jgi:hypothetical protein
LDPNKPPTRLTQEEQAEIDRMVLQYCSKTHETEETRASCQLSIS